jgi:microcystin degradation protein MlrC
MKIAVGMIMQETNSFSTIPTDIDDFRYSSLLPLLEGQELVNAHRGRETEVGGFLRVCEAHGVDVVPTIATFAVPSGNVTDRAFRWLQDLLMDQLAHAGDLDGVLLALHGSMIVDGLDDAEGELLAKVRGLVGVHAYVGCSLDLHANVTRKMVDNADILVGYETHVDYGETGARVAELLIQCAENGVRSQRFLRKIPAVWAAHDYVLDMKRRLEQEAGVLTISLFDDNPWSDVEEYGPGVVVIVEEGEPSGARICAELATALWDVRHKAVVDTISIPEAISRVQQVDRDNRPIVLIESGDLIGGGGAGDSVALLSALLSNGVTDVASVIYDPGAVSEAFRAGLGAQVEMAIGGKHDGGERSPLPFSGIVRMLFDGKYTLRGVPYDGMSAYLGRTAVVGAGSTDIVLSSKRIYPQGRALFDALGTDVSQKRALALKGFSSGSRSPAFDFPLGDVLYVSTPGWSNWDFRTVPYRKISRSLYPLDPDAALT